MSDDPITTFFREAQARILVRQLNGRDAIRLVRGFGVAAGRNGSVVVQRDHPLYHHLAAIADHLAAGDYPELK